jgi:hypothetical protein
MEIKKHYACISAAIREGAKLRPKCTCVLFSGGKSCSFGAAVEAIFGAAGYEVEAGMSDLLKLYPYLNNPSVCPVCEKPDRIWVVAAEHLNDMHDFTREQISSWLYTEEEKLGFITLTEEASECVIQRTSVAEEVASVSALRI